MEWTVITALAAAFVAMGTGAGVVLTVKSDNRVLKQRLDAVDKQLAKMDNVLVTLAENKGRMDMAEQRAILQGQRIDNITQRFDNWIDDNGPYAVRHKDLEDHSRALEQRVRSLESRFSK